MFRQQIKILNIYCWMFWLSWFLKRGSHWAFISV